MSLARPWMLGLLAFLPILAWLYVQRLKRPTASIRFSDLKQIRILARRHRPRWRHVPFILRMFALSLLIVALAGPRLHRTFEEIVTHGVDIMLAIDCSGSMKAEDFKPKNRLHVAKQVVQRFINGRRHDRIGLVVFAGAAFTQCPLTLDYGILKTFVHNLQIGTVEKDGTAIGPALAAALNRLRESKAKSRVIVLLTDGAENVQNLKVNYKQAALLAQALGVKIYAVAVGRDDDVPMRIQDPLMGERLVWFRAELNEEGLKEIASITGGRYFRATDSDALYKIFNTIDKLERSEIKTKNYTRYEEIFTRFLYPALLVLLLEIFLVHTRFRTLP